MDKGTRKSGWLDHDGTDEHGRHRCSTPYILAHDGLFAPKVGASWGCKCGRVWAIARVSSHLEWQEVVVNIPGVDEPAPTVEALATELIAKLPAWLPNAPEAIVPAVLQELAAKGLIRLSEVPPTA